MSNKILMRKTLFFAILGIILVVAVAFDYRNYVQRLDDTINASETYAARHFFGAKFEPENTVLHGAGQSEDYEFPQYLEVNGPDRHPLMYMLYIKAKYSADEMREEVAEFKKTLSLYPDNMMLQLGLSMLHVVDGKRTGYCSDVINGKHDEGLKVLAQLLDSLDRKIFLRIGYEANGFWNDYDPEDYKKAFHHISDIMRNASDNIATVWHIHNIDGVQKLMRYYPGDEYADWWAMSVFPTRFLHNQSAADFLDLAEEHKKPVMMAECAPSEAPVGSGLASWNYWFSDVFTTIREEPVIKAFCYINRDWRYSERLAYWGNSALNDDSVVAELYRQEIGSSLFEHLSPPPNQSVVNIVSTDGAYVSSSDPDASFTQKEEILVRESRGDTLTAYVSFDWSDYASEDIIDAKLFLMGRSEADDYQELTVYLAENEQDWHNITWNHRPTLKDSLGTVEFKRGLRKKRLSITKHVHKLNAEGKTNVTIAFSKPEKKDCTYAIHSHLAPFYPPVLQLVYNRNPNFFVDASYGQASQLSELYTFHNYIKARSEMFIYHCVRKYELLIKQSNE